MSVYEKAGKLLSVMLAIPGIKEHEAIGLWMVALDVWCLAAATRVAMLVQRFEGGR